MDIPNLLNEHFPNKLAADPAKFRAIGAKFQINITGPGGGMWNIDATSTGPSIRSGTGPADCTITISEPDAQKLIENPISAMSLFMTGRLEVSGNKLLAMKLNTLFG